MIVSYRHKVDSFTFGRCSEVARIENGVRDAIADFAVCFFGHFLLKVVPNRPERVAVVVTGEVFNVLKEEHLGSVMLRDLIDLEEQRAAWVLEALLLPGDAESLAGEASTQNVMRRDEI